MANLDVDAVYSQAMVLAEGMHADAVYSQVMVLSPARIEIDAVYSSVIVLTTLPSGIPVGSAQGAAFQGNPTSFQGRKGQGGPESGFQGR